MVLLYTPGFMDVIESPIFLIRFTPDQFSLALFCSFEVALLSPNWVSRPDH